MVGLMAVPHMPGPHGSSVLGLLSLSNAVQCDSGVSVGMMQCCAAVLTGV